MIQETVLTLATDAITAGNQEAFNVPAHCFRNGQEPSLIAQGIDGTETMTLYIADGSGWQQVFDNQATPVAAQIDPTNNKTTITLNTPGRYGVIKDATSAEIQLKLIY